MACTLFKNVVIFPRNPFRGNRFQFGFYIPLAGILLLVSCTSSINIKPEFQDPDFSFRQIQPQTPIKLFISETVSLPEFRGEYRNSYFKLYQSDRQFVSMLQKQIADSIAAILGALPDPSGSSDDASLLQAAGLGQNTISVDQMRQLFGAAVANYFFVVTSVDITGEVMSNGPVLISRPGSGGTFINGGGDERCVITIRVDLWSVKNRRKVLSYSSEGDSEVAHSTYDLALKRALSISIGYLVRYLATGSVE